MPKLSLPESPMVPAVAPTRRSHHRKRGGAWKVAYADFVTAMMALFIVLWMMSATDAVKKSVVGYFKDPRGYTQTLGAGPGHSGEGLVMQRNTVGELQNRLKQALAKHTALARTLPAALWGAVAALLFTDSGIVAALLLLAPTAVAMINGMLE